MNSKFLLLLFSVAGFTSCSTAYRSSQTPDDVYFSPVRPVDDDERRDEQKDSTFTVNNAGNDSNYPSSTIGYPRSRDYDYDYGYRYPRHRRYRSNSTYVYVDPKLPGGGKPIVTTKPRKFNPKSYSSDAPSATSDPVRDPKTGKTTTTSSSRGNTPVRTFDTRSSNSGSALGNIMKNIFNGSGSDNNNSSSGSSRSSSTSNSSSSGSSSGSSGSNSAPVRTFGKQ